MHPFVCGYVDYTAIVPTFSSTCTYINLNTLFVGIAFSEQSESLVSIIRIVTYYQNPCSIRCWIDLVPKSCTEFITLQVVHWKSEIRICSSLERISAQKGVPRKSWITYFTSFLKTDKIHIICIKRHIKDFSIKLSAIWSQFGKVYLLDCCFAFGIGSRYSNRMFPITQSIVGHFFQHDPVIFKRIECCYL